MVSNKTSVDVYIPRKNDDIRVKLDLFFLRIIKIGKNSKNINEKRVSLRFLELLILALGIIVMGKNKFTLSYSL